MRLWPYQILPYVPGPYLLSQWRECVAVSNMLSNGTLNHATVNRVKDYSTEHMVCYCKIVQNCMEDKNYRIGTNVLEKLNQSLDYSNMMESTEIHMVADAATHHKCVIGSGDMTKVLFDSWHDERYLRQCLYMFEEKHDCGMLTSEEWTELVRHFPGIFIE